MKNVIWSLAVAVVFTFGASSAQARDPYARPHTGCFPQHNGFHFPGGNAPAYGYGGLNTRNFGGAYSNFGPYGSGVTLYFGSRPTVARYYFSPTLNRSCGCSQVHGPCRHHAGPQHGHGHRSW